MKKYKVKKYNNWEVWTYKFGNKVIQSEQEYDFLFPNGTVEKRVVHGRPVINTVHDMGHEYQVSTRQLYITVVYNGLCVEIPIEQLHIVK